MWFGSRGSKKAGDQREKMRSDLKGEDLVCWRIINISSSFCYRLIVEEQSKQNLEEGIESTVYIEMEETSQYTSSYSRSIIEYSDIEESDAIVLLLGNREDDYFNLTDQENILLNRLGKPILCL